MKKQELKQDPIRDYIISSYNYLIDNKNITYSVAVAFGLSLFLFVYVSNKNNTKNISSNMKSSNAQNLYILGDQNSDTNSKETAINQFNEFLLGNHNQESINQAIIYLIRDAKDNKNDISEIINSNKFRSDDDFMYSLYNGIVGDYYVSIDDLTNATKYYDKALTNFNDYQDSLLDFKLSFIHILVNQNMINRAKIEFDSINSEELSFGSKNKYDLIKSDFITFLK